MKVEKQFRVKLGHLRSETEVREELAKKDCHVHLRTEPMFTAACSNIVGGRWQRFCVVEVESLGFPQGGPLGEIFSEALSLRNNLLPCPPGAGHMLRLAYLEQKGGELLYIAMLPIRHPISDKPLIYVLTRGFGGLLLYCDFAYPTTYMHPKDKLVFMEQ